MSNRTKKNDYDTVVIGGGPAGLAGGVKAEEFGLKTLILENGDRIGGIPIQCIHPGFGNFYYEEDLTGPEFSNRLIEKVESLDLEYRTNAHVSEITNVSDLRKEIKVFTPENASRITTSTIIYATGARERHLFETGICGDRVSGIYTAGETQTLMDIQGVMPGKEVVIVGSGDIGLIMARRFALEGADVKGVMEMLPYPTGLTRNVSQCLRDLDIPLHTGRAVKKVRGEGRVEEVITVKVNEDLQEIPGTQKSVECDTVVLATGLIPYTKKLERIDVEMDPMTKGPVVNEFLETNISGVFAAGNVLAINDYVDYAAEQGELAAEGAKIFVENETIPSREWVPIKKGRNVRFVVPHYLSGERNVSIYSRAKKPEIRVKINFPEIGREIKKPSVRPGDMIKIELGAEDLASLSDGLTMEVIR
ncbi:pyridine nucleotide-disulfide oxidoreductase [candidate division MSBL1 archaeon SCGC-AAA259E19]|uniref:Pyridine nucleotide-disulfide oxidoreductase n=1 Tax=candidate division MSBL1 archaeon SCGC-AAA259E19 TaxID=1698264 RepID=A0A133UKX3_9EURY|nr:pyridine nucleotide-disulfide oxidoreductase [candidate division MSBL1 archaeon SCGC-AAA259E19]